MRFAETRMSTHRLKFRTRSGVRVPLMFSMFTWATRSSISSPFDSSQACSNSVRVAGFMAMSIFVTSSFRSWYFS
jgi:hypothetical protein